jgi:DNA replicative helicase MCM subunit Mcm2 (Cdc46/Mcm family)
VPEDALKASSERLQKAIEHATHAGEINRDKEARAIWYKVYPELPEGKPGLLGAMTSRAEAHVMRLSAIYAPLDCSAIVRAEHLKAALALWEYCEASRPLHLRRCVRRPPSPTKSWHCSVRTPRG